MAVESPRESVVVLHIVTFDCVAVRLVVEKNLDSACVKDHVTLVLLDVASHKASKKAVATDFGHLDGPAPRWGGFETLVLCVETV